MATSCCCVVAGEVVVVVVLALGVVLEMPPLGARPRVGSGLWVVLGRDVA